MALYKLFLVRVFTYRWTEVLAHFKDLDGNVLTLLGKEAEGLS